MTTPTLDIPDDYSAGRVWTTDFSDQTATNTAFTLTNYGYVTDPVTGAPAVQQTNTLFGGGPFQISSIVAKEKLAACDVFVRSRQVNGSTNTGQGGGRGSTMAGVRRGSSVWVAGTLYGEGEGTEYTGMAYNWAGGYSGNRLDQHTPDVAQSDTASFRCLRFQVFEDALRYKSWREQDGEPDDWRYLTRVATLDLAPDFLAGLFAWVLDASFISHLTVTELLRTSENLVSNTSYDLIDSLTGSPLWWTQDMPGGSDATMAVETIPDQNGEMRACLKVSSPAGSDVGSGLWQQGFFNSAVLGPNTISTFVRSWPLVPTFPPLVTVAVWSKGQNITETPGGNGLAAGYVNYYYDFDAVLQSYNSRIGHRYYEGLGPSTLAIANPPAGVAGSGTWDWYKTTYVMDYVSASRLFSSTVSLGLHDDTATGTLWIGDVSIVPYDPAVDPPLSSDAPPASRVTWYAHRPTLNPDLVPVSFDAKDPGRVTDRIGKGDGSRLFVQVWGQDKDSGEFVDPRDYLPRWQAHAGTEPDPEAWREGTWRTVAGESQAIGAAVFVEMPLAGLGSARAGEVWDYGTSVGGADPPSA